MAVYIFYREEGFYPIELNNDADAIANAEINDGTIKVENDEGAVIWQDRLKSLVQ